MTSTTSPLVPVGWRHVRADFPVLSRTVDGVPVVYLDSAATSLKPRAVTEAVVRYYTEVSANIHRGKHMLSEEASDEYERARQRVAEFVGARSESVVFTPGTTYGVNLVAAGLGLSADDVVLVGADTHHSQQLPWRRHARVEFIPVGTDGAVDLARYAELLRQRPKVVAITHCSNVTGRYAPVAAMAGLAREHGALVVVDGAQSVPHRPVDVAALGADALVFSAHKMLGPTGIGVLVLGPSLIDRLPPWSTGGGMVDWVDTEQVVWRRAPHRFEAGTPHIAGTYGLRAAVDYLDELGMAEVAEHDRRLGELLSAEAARRDYLSVLGPLSGDRGGIVSVAVRGRADLTELARMLSDSFGVMCRTGHHCAQPYVESFGRGQVLRISGYVYTNEQDVRAAFDALDQTVPLLGG
ncbi:MAG TPA: aminotransferase class V-fold PLP-dependent enzyme [Pseudonocardiaceae bacterium]|nr:aminotransferase class V-fold PLP-dependent enzyme [Pseudonocardiaceae bacterium]